MEAFPADIREYGERAQRHLVKAKEIKEPIALANVSIDSVRDIPAKVDGLLSEGIRTTSQWYLVFNFSFEKPTGELVQAVSWPVVMLLDGTIAEEQTITDRK